MMNKRLTIMLMPVTAKWMIYITEIIFGKGFEQKKALKTEEKKQNTKLSPFVLSVCHTELLLFIRFFFVNKPLLYSVNVDKVLVLRKQHVKNGLDSAGCSYIRPDSAAERWTESLRTAWCHYPPFSTRCSCSSSTYLQIAGQSRPESNIGYDFSPLGMPYKLHKDHPTNHVHHDHRN